jgi:hypothetical protein
MMIILWEWDERWLANPLSSRRERGVEVPRMAAVEIFAPTHAERCRFHTASWLVTFLEALSYRSIRYDGYGKINARLLRDQTIA